MIPTMDAVKSQHILWECIVQQSGELVGASDGNGRVVVSVEQPSEGTY